MANEAGTLLLLGGAALGGWWLYENYFSGGLPSDAVPMPTGQGGQSYLSSGQSASISAGTGGQTQTLTGPGYLWYGPAEKQWYVSATEATAAQIAAQNQVGSIIANLMTSSASTASGTTNTSTNGTTPVTTATSSTPTSSTPATVGESSTEPATYPTPGGGSAATPTNLAGLWSAILPWVAQDTNFSGSSGSYSGTGDHWMFYVTEVWPNAPAGYSGVWPPDFATVFPGVDESAQMTQSTFWTGIQTYLQGQGLSGFRGMGCDGGGSSAVTTLIAAAALGVACVAFGRRGIA